MNEIIVVLVLALFVLSIGALLLLVNYERRQKGLGPSLFFEKLSWGLIELAIVFMAAYLVLTGFLFRLPPGLRTMGVVVLTYFGFGIVHHHKKRKRISALTYS